MKPEHNEVLASFKGERNRMKKSLSHSAQEQSVIAKDYKNFPMPTVPKNNPNLKGHREREEETKVEKNVSHTLEYDKNNTEQIFNNFPTSTAAGGYQEKVKESYREVVGELVTEAPEEEEESFTTSDEGEDSNVEEKIKAIVLQLRPVLDGSYKKTSKSKRSNLFEDTDGQLHFDTFKDLQNFQRAGKDKQSPGESIFDTFYSMTFSDIC